MIIKEDLFSVFKVSLLLILLASNINFAQDVPGKSRNVDEYLSKLPKEFKLEENEPQQYCITSKLHNRDISGKTINKILITAEFTRALDDGFVRWNNVRIAGSSDPAKPISEDMLQEYKYMEGFSYNISADIMKEEFYKDFPNNDTKNLIKILVWDEVMIEPFLWNNLDKLKLNEFVRVSDFEDFTVQMGNWGTIKMRDLKLKWTGISKMNEKICALIHYQSFSNPVVSISNSMAIKGRSLYWGCISVSLEGKQIEYGTLNEDVMMEMTSPSNSGKRLLNMQREVIFEKVQERHNKNKNQKAKSKA